MSNISNRRLVAVLVATALSGNLYGCSSYIFDLAQDSALQRCDQYATTAEKSECRRANGKSYDDYRIDREKANRTNKQ
jgi:hypothetical protein